MRGVNRAGGATRQAPASNRLRFPYKISPTLAWTPKKAMGGADDHDDLPDFSCNRKILANDRRGRPLRGETPDKGHDPLIPEMAQANVAEPLIVLIAVALEQA